MTKTEALVALHAILDACSKNTPPDQAMMRTFADQSRERIIKSLGVMWGESVTGCCEALCIKLIDLIAGPQSPIPDEQ